MPATSNFTWRPELLDEAVAKAGYGIQAATLFVKNTTKEVLSVPAPRIRVTGKDGAVYYIAGYKTAADRIGAPYEHGSKYATVADYKFPKGGMGPPERRIRGYYTAPAIKGDPPRKLSGRLWASIQHEFLDPMARFGGGSIPTRGRVGTNVKYARALEYHKNDHDFLSRVVTKFRPQIEAMVKGAADA